MVVRETVVLGNRYGLHARAACRFVETCKQFESEVTVSRDGTRADGKSILEVLTLGAEHGCTVDIEIVGEDAGKAAEALVHLVNIRFGEDDAGGEACTRSRDLNGPG